MVPPAVVVTRRDGLITIAQAALLCGVKQVTVRVWISRGYVIPRNGLRRHLPVARREGRIVLLDPREVAIADHATAARARRPAVYAA